MSSEPESHLTDSPDIAVPREALRALFDLAINSLDFGSGFWERQDIEAARRIAEVIGVCPMIATPSDVRRQYPTCPGMDFRFLGLGRHHDHPVEAQGGTPTAAMGALLAFWRFWHDDAGHYDASVAGLVTGFDAEDARRLEELSDAVEEALGESSS